MNVMRLICGWYTLTMMLHHPASAQESRPPVTISKETTYIVSPLRKDGRVDYIAALNQQFREGVTLDNNSVVIFRRAIGRKGLSPMIVEEYFQQLGIEVPPEDGEYLLDLDAFLDTQESLALPLQGIDRSSRYERRSRIYKQHDAASSRPWTREEFPIIASWVDANEAPLMLVLEGSRRTKYFAPLVPSEGSVAKALTLSFDRMREATALLIVRSMLRLGESNPGAAWQDVMAVHRLARLRARGSVGSDFLAGSHIELMACRCDDQIAFHENLSSELARKCLRELIELELTSGPTDLFNVGERYLYLSTVVDIAGQDEERLRKYPFMLMFDEGDECVAEFVRTSLIERAVDLDTVLRTGNLWLDKYSKADQLPTRTARVEEIARLESQQESTMSDLRQISFSETPFTREESSRIVGRAFRCCILPPVSSVYAVHDRCEMRTQLSYFALALAAWKAAHGEYPSELAHLSPDYLETVPTDRFNNKPLIYRRSDVGYILYSVGLNLRDDGGITLSDAFAIDGIATDDIAVRTPDEDERIRAWIQARRSK